MQDVISDSVISTQSTAIQGLKSHLTLSQEMIDVCRPLSHINFDYFHFIRSYSDSSRVSLTNNLDWMAHYYHNAFYQIPSLTKQLNKNQSGYHLWTSQSTSPVLISLRLNFSIGSGIILVDRYDDYCNFYYFGSKKSLLLENILPDHLISLARRFIFYFNDQCEHLIKKADNQRIFVQENDAPIDREYPDNGYQQFLSETSFNRHILNDGKNQFIFSKREFDCIQYLVKGYSAKSIANQLDISSRTVEYHVDKIRTRMGCHNKSHLIEKLIHFPLEYVDS